MPDLSIIVVSWNTKELLINCIESIISYAKDIDYELIVVDNASTDGSLEYLENRLIGSNQTLIKNDSNTGFAFANNQGFAISKGKYIALVNSDIKVHENAIQNLLKTLNHNPKIGAISCDLRGDDNISQSIHRRFPNFLTVLFTRTRIGAWLDHRILKKKYVNHYLYKDIDRVGLKYIDQAAAAFLLLKRNVVNTINGLFSESFPIYGNDVDLCKRIHLSSYQVAVDYDVKVWHKGSASTKQLSKELSKNISNSWLKLFFKLYHSNFEYFLVKLIIK